MKPRCFRIFAALRSHAGIALLALAGMAPGRAAEVTLPDLSAWERYRGNVVHPSGTIKPGDLARARENLRRYAWARSYAAGVERAARAAAGQVTPEFVERMIPETTPGDPKFTPCPACRDQGKPVHPHGLWSWSSADPDRIACDVCGTVFPHEKYPETIALQARRLSPQTLTFYGGEPFVIFGYKTGRPSFSANIRSRKVSHLAGLARTLAEAHLLTGDAAYARGVRMILLRFAACYPCWMVHTGYGEYADLDPRTASQFINQLPEPELCPPPNRPDHRLHTGYWSAGRAGGVGQESAFVRRMVESYDFTCDARGPDGTPIYTAAERRTIERDLLIESTFLLVADQQINNKSVGNRAAAALVGLCVGDPALVRFGWEGFERTIDGWFLPDGTTSESPSYALMTLGNIWDMAEALRGYSDPPGYTGPAGGRRVDRLDPYHGTAYEKVWTGMFNGLLGDLRYPPYADSHRTSALGGQFVELMVARYPERAEFLALLRENCGDDLSRGVAPLALYSREPGLERKPSPPLKLPDGCPPDLRIGHLRTGADGRESLLLLSASHWGGHHHLDSLNLSYWKQGAEVLSDLGYLWDHPQKQKTTRTLAHNTVLIDGRDQATRERGGDVAFFETSTHVKVMEATSRAYPEAGEYRRTSAVIDHGGGRNYVVDFFRVRGGRSQDYVYHAAATCQVDGLALSATSSIALYDFANVRTADGAVTWRAAWPAGPKLTAVAWNLGQPGERVFIADGWGQRDWRNSDLGATLPYLVRRTEGGDARTFVSVFEAHDATGPFVRSVRRTGDPDVIVVETALGTDTVFSRPASGAWQVRTADGEMPLAGRFAVAAVRDGRLAWSFVVPKRP